MLLTNRFEEALIYANRLHSTQKKKGTGTPYVAHLLGVASIALEFGAGEDEAIAALLHDAVEDQGGLQTLAEIRRRFGMTVANIVDGCTDSYESPKPPWKDRKGAYIDHVRTASPSIRLVSAADKLHNTRAILRDYRLLGDAVWDRFAVGREEVIRYYRSLVEAFRASGTNQLVDELDRVVSEIERFAAKGPLKNNLPFC